MDTKNKAAARREIEDFEGRGAPGADLFAPGYKLHFGGAPPMDLAGHQAVLGSFRAAFPDLSIEVQAQLAEGDIVVNHFTMRGTHRGAFQGVPATGKRIETSGTNMMRFENGKIAETWGIVDAVTMMQQLGAMPPDPAPAGLGPLAQPGNATTTEASKAAVRAFVDGFNRKDSEGLARHCSDEYVLDFPGGPKGRGIAGIKQATAEFIAAFPDLQFSIDTLVGEGDLVAWRWCVSATHRGQLGPFAASGKPVRFNGISLLRVRAGRIVEDRVRADVPTMLQQIGAMPVA